MQFTLLDKSVEVCVTGVNSRGGYDSSYHNPYPAPALGYPPLLTFLPCLSCNYLIEGRLPTGPRQAPGLLATSRSLLDPAGLQFALKRRGHPHLDHAPGLIIHGFDHILHHCHASQRTLHHHSLVGAFSASTPYL